jgi:hypothetical protein
MRTAMYCSLEYIKIPNVPFTFYHGQYVRRPTEGTTNTTLQAKATKISKLIFAII